MNNENRRENIESIYQQGLSYFQSGNLSAAKNCFSRVEQIKPDHSMSLNNLGVIAYSENKISLAEEYFLKACDSDPENYDAAANLANLCFSEKKYDEAEKLFLFLSEKFPSDHEYFLKLGDCYVVFAEYTTAYNYYKIAGNLKPDDKRIIKRINLLASALTSLPFYVPKPDNKEKIKIGYGTGLDFIREFEKFSFVETYKIKTPSAPELDYSNPLDFLIIKEESSFFEEKLPAVCRILIFNSDSEIPELNESQRLNNIDYIICNEDNLAEKLISDNIFADYQVKITDIETSISKRNIEAVWNYLKSLYIEMVLFYADLLELQDCYEQAYRILQKTSVHFPDELNISGRFNEAKNKINHLFEPGSYVDLYIESAEESTPNYNVFSLKRFNWLLNQIRSFNDGSSIIDIGCHKGEFCFALAEQGYNMTGIDIAEKNIDCAKQHLKKVHNLKENVDFFVSNGINVHNIFPEDRFDCAILCEILEHVPDVEAVLSSVEKVVKPGGYIFITVPFTHLETIHNLIFDIPQKYAEHVRRFNLQNIHVYFKDKTDLFLEEITAVSGSEEQKWLGIRYRTP